MGLVFSSRIITVLLGIFLVPFYIKFLGVESYGLVAFYSTLAGALAILGFGLSSSSSREITILNAQNASSTKISSLLFSVEIINWVVAIIVGVLILMFSSAIAKYWVNTREINIVVLTNSIMLMGLLFVCQLPGSVYEGALNGMQRQRDVAIINIIFAIIKSVGVIFVLKYINSSIIAFFFWQLFVTFSFTLSLRYRAYRSLNSLKNKKYFSWKLLNSIKSYALGMTSISLITFFISQIDKVIVSKYLLLEVLGYYNLAFLLANILRFVVLSFQTIVQPKFNTYVAQSRNLELKLLYYKVCKWIAILIIPAGIILVAFSWEILFLWTGNKVLADATSPILKLVSLGTAFNCIASVFYFYTLAKGDTKFVFYQNLVGVFIMLPLIIILTKEYGVIGTASCWLIYNTLLLIVSLPVFHFIYLRGELAYWFRHTFISPVILSCIIFFGGKWLQEKLYPSINLLELVLIVFILTIIYALILKETRNFISDLIKEYSQKLAQ